MQIAVYGVVHHLISEFVKSSGITIVYTDPRDCDIVYYEMMGWVGDHTNIRDNIGNDTIEIILSDKRKLLVLDNSAEGFNGDELERFLQHFSIDTGIQKSQLVFLTSNLNFKKSKYAIVRHFLFWAYHANCYQVPDYNVVSKPDRAFIFLNRRVRRHRSILMNELMKLGMVENGYVSFRVRDDLGKHISMDFFGDGYEFTPLVGLLDDVILDVKDVNENPVVEISEYYDKAYVDIIAETFPGKGAIFFSEKTFRALKTGKPFLMLNEVGSLNTIRDFGFSTDFGIDQSYDMIDDDIKRIQSLASVVPRLVERFNSGNIQNDHMYSKHNICFYNEFLLSNRYSLKILRSLRRLTVDEHRMPVTSTIIKSSEIFTDHQHIFAYIQSSNGLICNDPFGVVDRSLSQMLKCNGHSVIDVHVSKIKNYRGKKKYLEIPFVLWASTPVSEYAMNIVQWYVSLSRENMVVFYDYWEADLSKPTVQQMVFRLVSDYKIPCDQVILFSAGDCSITNKQKLDGPAKKMHMIDYEYFRAKVFMECTQHRNHTRNKNIKYRFLCLNRVCKPHRSYIWFHYHDNHKFKISYNTDNTSMSEYEGSLTLLDIDQHRLGESFLQIPRAFCTNFDGENSVDLSRFLGISEDCGIYLITETFYDEPDMLFYTEKTWKAIAGKMPFIMVSNHGMLSRLREKGFRTFSPYINEQYDSILDGKLRISMIKFEIDRILSLSECEFSELINNLKEITEYNYNHFVNSDVRTKLNKG